MTSGASCSRSALPDEPEEGLDVFVREGARPVKRPDRRHHSLFRAEPRIGAAVVLHRRDDNVQCAEITIFHGRLDVRVHGAIGIGT